MIGRGGDNLLGTATMGDFSASIGPRPINDRLSRATGSARVRVKFFLEKSHVVVDELVERAYTQLMLRPASHQPSRLSFYLSISTQYIGIQMCVLMSHDGNAPPTVRPHPSLTSLDKPSPLQELQCLISKR